MNPIRHIRRSAAVLAGLALLVALARRARVRQSRSRGRRFRGATRARSHRPHLVAGGMPGWQIALIAVAAALLAAALAVLADRALAARRRLSPRPPDPCTPGRRWCRPARPGRAAPPRVGLAGGPP